MITKEQLLTAGAERLSDIILTLYQRNKEIQKQLDIIVAGLNDDPKKITSLLKKEISSYKRSTRFIDYYEFRNYANNLDQLRQRIFNDLTEKSPEQALELMSSFLELQKSVLERADDSNGEIGGVFIAACANFGSIAEKAVMKPEKAVKIVYKNFINDDYGIYDSIIHDFKDALTKEGLDLLKKQLEDAYNPANQNIYKNYSLIRGIKSIADYKKDVGEYIRACSFGKQEIKEEEHLEIAKRLVQHWRCEEALEWLNKINSAGNNHIYAEEYFKLKIEALELACKHEEAQVERLKWFDKTLSPIVYGEVLKHAKPEDKENFRLASIKQAFKFTDISLGLNFLTKIQESEEAARFVHLKVDELNGNEYYTIRPIADIVCNVDPLAATVLYREMIEPILASAKSKYYNYAAKDLVACSVLNRQITDWKSYQNHDQYFKSIEGNNKRKTAFWAEYKSVL